MVVSNRLVILEFITLPFVEYTLIGRVVQQLGTPIVKEVKTSHLWTFKDNGALTV